MAGEKSSEPGDASDELPTTDRTHELGQFLRSRRARISPEQAGFPVGTRRRSPGLRREEVAVLAGLSPTWYAYLEQGRKIRPSPEVLDRLARVLGLSLEERRYMHLLALGHPPEQPGAAPDPAPADEIWGLVRVIGNSNCPVYVGNQYGDVIAWNQAFCTYYSDFGQIPEDRRNMLAWLLSAPEARDRIQDWAEDTRDVVGRLRAAYAMRQQDPRFERRVRELTALSQEFRQWWSEHDVVGQKARHRTIHVPGLGRQTFRMFALRLADDGFMSAIVHVPVQE